MRRLFISMALFFTLLNSEAQQAFEGVWSTG